MVEIDNFKSVYGEESLPGKHVLQLTLKDLQPFIEYKERSIRTKKNPGQYRLRKFRTSWQS